MNETTELDIVVPVYDERENLRPLFEEVKAALEGEVANFRVLFVDDGSTDGSTDVIKNLAAESDNVTGLHFTKNRGQSAAFATGFEVSDKPLVVTIDGDRQNDPADITRLLATMREEGTDVVLGYREERNDSFKKKVGSVVANRVRNWILGEEILDTGCSLKLFRREVVDAFPWFEGMHRFFPSLVLMNGFTLVQIPTNHRPRPWGQTKYSLTGRFSRVVFDLIGVAWLKGRSLNPRIDEKSN